MAIKIHKSYWGANYFDLKIILSIFGLIIFLLLSAGCSAFPPNDSAQQTSDPLVGNTITPTETQSLATQVFPQSMATEIPTATPTIETSLYIHPDGLYEFAYPSTWTVNQGNDSTTITGPGGNVSIDVHLVNTRYALDEPSLVRLVEGRESNAFGSFEKFYEYDRQVDSDQGSLIIRKEFTADGEAKSVTTLYRQSGQMVFILDHWTDQSVHKDSEPVLTNVINSLMIEEPVERNLASMHFSLFMPYDSELFSLAVPQYWNFNRTTGSNSVVDTYTSPDQHAVVQIAIYDDGDEISGAAGGAFVRNLLRNYYANDIVVTSDLLLADGREELIWKSTTAEYQGRSYFDKRDTTLYIITVMTDNDYVEYYGDLIDFILSSYDNQPAIEG
ncbi:hypothetical protein ACFLY4_03620 [Chloroflexota bacterium]